MSVRVVGAEETRRLLPMAECIAAMAEVLTELARAGLHNPLRSVVRAPGSGSCPPTAAATTRCTR